MSARSRNRRADRKRKQRERWPSSPGTWSGEVSV